MSGPPHSVLALFFVNIAFCVCMTAGAFYDKYIFACDRARIFLFNENSVLV